MLGDSIDLVEGQMGGATRQVHAMPKQQQLEYGSIVLRVVHKFARLKMIRRVVSLVTLIQV
jgi:hypothetical protein